MTRVGAAEKSGTRCQGPGAEGGLSGAPDDSAHGGVIRRNIDLDGVARDDSDHSAFAHLAGRTGCYLVTGFQLHAERCIGECFNNNTLRPEVVVLTCDENLQSTGPHLGMRP